MTKNQLTKEGHSQLVSELGNLKDWADRLITKIEEVAQPDESGEDSLVSQLKAELEVVNAKISSIESVLENFEIITGKNNSSTVQIGSKVKIKVVGNSEKTFYLVGELEADPSSGKISSQSPLGLALMGKKVNEKFEVDAPAGKLTYKIVSIA
ncbi:MAG: GreA/GreB family elongation factor [Candidatus Shapirobacteria bacterium]|jgi:transcription elongation factor GreA|nr:GreA/GreB family elongation factor [Candidatus Shapirobacteria bacterium]